jgi:hypothetical protein
MGRTGTVERAFELARDGKHRSVDDLRRQLIAEQHSSIDLHLGSRTLRKQLRALLAEQSASTGTRSTD